MPLLPCIQAHTEFWQCMWGGALALPLYAATCNVLGIADLHDLVR